MIRPLSYISQTPFLVPFGLLLCKISQSILSGGRFHQKHLTRYSGFFGSGEHPFIELSKELDLWDVRL